MEVWVLVGFAEKTFWNLRSYILDEGSLIFCCMGSQVNVILKFLLQIVSLTNLIYETIRVMELVQN